MDIWIVASWVVIEIRKNIWKTIQCLTHREGTQKMITMIINCPLIMLEVCNFDFWFKGIIAVKFLELQKRVVLR